MDLKPKVVEAIGRSLKHDTSNIPIMFLENSKDANDIIVIVLYTNLTIAIASTIADDINRSLALYPELESVTAVIDHKVNAQKWAKLDKPEYSKQLFGEGSTSK